MKPESEVNDNWPKLVPVAEKQAREAVDYVANHWDADSPGSNYPDPAYGYVPPALKG